MAELAPEARRTVDGLAVPQTLQQALEPAWLTRALSPVSGGAAVVRAEPVEVIRTMATKVRFVTEFAGGASAAFCLKAFLDVDEQTARGGAVTVREADFYREIAPEVAVRTPDCVASIISADRSQGVIIMRDLVAAGARFCSALEPLSVDDAANSLEQIAALHAKAALLDGRAWIDRRIAALAEAQYIPQPMLQEMLDGPRGEGLPPGTRDAARLIAGLKALAELDATRAHTLVHGDAHAGNLYRTEGGFGLIDWQLLQRGNWALDVAYHIAAVLPVEVAEREERRLLDHYLEVLAAHGGSAPPREEAWEAYLISPVYGYYLWSITRRVDPAITNVFVQRLGASVTRHSSFQRLSV